MHKKVIVFGTFDIFHPGHKDFFEQAKKLGDYLTVVVARDKNVQKIKGGLPSNNESSRLTKIKKSNLVDEAILGNNDDKYKILQQQQPDVICLGYDQKVNMAELQKKLKEYKLNKVKIIRLNAFRPEIYKSSKIKSMNSLEQKIKNIEKRNKRVELDKAWEVSLIRKLMVTFLTYVVIVLFFKMTNLPSPFINAIVPTLGFLLSTLTISYVKAIWINKQVNK